MLHHLLMGLVVSGERGPEPRSVCDSKTRMLAASACPLAQLKPKLPYGCKTSPNL